MAFVESELNFLKIIFRSLLLSFLYKYSYKNAIQESYELLENSRIVVRVVRPWHRLAREAMDASSLVVFKGRLHGALNNLVKWKWSHGERVVFNIPSIDDSMAHSDPKYTKYNYFNVCVYIYIYRHTRICIYIYIRVCVCIYVKMMISNFTFFRITKTV